MYVCLGLQAQKNWTGRIFFLLFQSLFFSIKRAHRTMKQDLVKFIYTQVINYEVTPSRSH